MSKKPVPEWRKLQMRELALRRAERDKARKADQWIEYVPVKVGKCRCGRPVAFAPDGEPYRSCSFCLDRVRRVRAKQAAESAAKPAAVDPEPKPERKPAKRTTAFDRMFGEEDAS